jgi:16S rRNA A1518/A1519 N6-dimethyltransferase RsmA/KsgA/DIM1 with predicted DNA glycosylase/AP lyase activity
MVGTQQLVDARFKDRAWLWDEVYRQEGLFGIQRQPGTWVLEVGCGAGQLTVTLAQL